MQFRQQCRDFSRKVRLFFAQSPKIDETITFSKNYISFKKAPRRNNNIFKGNAFIILTAIRNTIGGRKIRRC